MSTKMADAYRERWVRQSLRATKVISSDVNPGINPLWSSAWEPTNAPRVGYGVNLKLYGRGFYRTMLAFYQSEFDHKP